MAESVDAYHVAERQPGVPAPIAARLSGAVASAFQSLRATAAVSKATVWSVALPPVAVFLRPVAFGDLFDAGPAARF